MDIGLEIQIDIGNGCVYATIVKAQRARLVYSWGNRSTIITTESDANGAYLFDEW